MKYNISFGEPQWIFYVVKHFLQQKKFASRLGFLAIAKILGV